MATKKPAKKVAQTKTRKRAATRSRVSFTTPVWSTACKDWEQRIVEGKTLTPCPPLFSTSAKLGMRVFENLLIVDAGVSFGDCRDWVKEFAEAVFGSYCDVEGHPLEGRRLIKTFFMLISKKNTKSTVAAGIMLTVLLLNWREEAEFLIIAPTKEAADNCFKPIRAAIEKDDELNHEEGGLIKVQTHIRTVTHMETGATLKVVAADSGTVVGKKATAVLIDELHEFGKNASAEDMLTEATGGLMSRPEGFTIYLSTQSSDAPAGVFKKKLDYARKVRDGKIEDNSFYPIIYEYPDWMIEQKLYLQEKYWYITNPNMGLTVDEETLRIKFREAREGGEDSLQGVLSKHFNIQIGIDLAENRWPAVEYWEETTSKRIKTLDDLLDLSEVVTIGVDGGGLDDLLALTACGRERDTGKLLLWSHAWANQSVLKLRKEIVPRLEDFQRHGDLSIVTHLGEDTEEMVGMIIKVNETGLLDSIGLDPARIQSLKRALETAGIDTEDKDFFKLIRQGWSLYGAMLYAERELAQYNVEHADQPLTAWCMGNACCKMRGNAMLLSKEVSGKAKIDPVMSMLNAMHLMSYNPAARSTGWDLSGMRLI